MATKTADLKKKDKIYDQVFSGNNFETKLGIY